MSGAQSLFQLALSGVHNLIKQQLTCTSVPPEVAKDILGSVMEKNQFTHPFLGLETTHKQHQFFKKNFRIVVSVMDILCIIIDLYDTMIITRSQSIMFWEHIRR